MKQRNKGQFTEGNSGKPKGAKNKMTVPLREAITAFLEGSFENAIKDYSKLKPVEKLKFYTELLQYSIPKLKTVSTNELENLTEEQLDKIIDKLKNKMQHEK